MIIFMEENLITITLKEYKKFLESKEILDALYAGGVDNWEYYEESLKEIIKED
jgi:hypothetical protein